MRSRFLVAVAGILACSLPAIAQQPGAVSTTASAPQAVELTTAQRGQLAEQIIARWMGEVMKSPGGDVKGWSSKLRKVVATADSANVISASTMPSLDLTHDALLGAAIDGAAVKAALSGAASTSAPQAIGSVDKDTTYTPLPGGRCRIASSLAINFPLPAGVTRVIDVEDVETFAPQGGVGSLNGDGSVNCGIPPMVTALALSVSSRSPTANGVLKVFANNRPNSVGNTILFSTAAGGGGSDLIVESCRTCAAELSILATAQTGYIIDVLGYFMPPVATALQCTLSTPNVTTIPPGNTSSAYANSCPSGYALVSTFCVTNSALTPLLVVGENYCATRNAGSQDATMTTTGKCCRVPGR